MSTLTALPSAAQQPSHPIRLAAQGAAQHVAKSLAHHGVVTDRLLSLTAPMGRQQLSILTGCEELFGEVERHHKKHVLPFRTAEFSPVARQLYLSLMFAAVFDRNYIEAKRACLLARHTDARELLQVLSFDAGCISTYAVSLSFVQPPATAALAATGTAATKAWAVGTLAAKAKAVGCCVAFGLVGACTAGAVYGLYLGTLDAAMAKDNERRKAYATEWGKDILFAEMIADKPYVATETTWGRYEAPENPRRHTREGGAR